MRDHLCQILAHYLLYFRWRLNFPIPHDTEPFILKGAPFRWHRKGLFQWRATVEDKAELDTEDWPTEDFPENDGEGSLNNTGLDTSFFPEMPLLSPSNFENDAQPWSTHATPSQERFHTQTNIAPFSTIYLPDMTCQSAQALFHCQRTSVCTWVSEKMMMAGFCPVGGEVAEPGSFLSGEVRKNSQTISTDQFGLNSEEHTVAGVPLQTATNSNQGLKRHLRRCSPSPRKRSNDARSRVMPGTKKHLLV
jgi:hypothetical protein